MNDAKQLKIPGSHNPAGDRAVIGWMRDSYKITGQFPNSALVRKAAPTHTSNIAMAGGLNQVLEFAIGKSPRTEILAAIVHLTTAACEGASTGEIAQHLARSGVILTLQSIGSNLREMRSDGHVVSVPIGRTMLWCLTKKGSQFMIDQGKAIKDFERSCPI